MKVPIKKVDDRMERSKNEPMKGLMIDAGEQSSLEKAIDGFIKKYLEIKGKIEAIKTRAKNLRDSNENFNI